MKLTEDELHARLVGKFFASVDERISKERCWNWTGPIHTNGYGRLAHGKYDGPNFYVNSGHRYSYLMHIGHIPEGKQVLHKCDNRKCVNPFHLFLGTQMDNMKDKIAKGRESRGESHSIATKSKALRGSQSKAAKLTEKDIPLILEMRKQGKQFREIGKHFNVTDGAIKHVVYGTNWSHITGINHGRI